MTTTQVQLLTLLALLLITCSNATGKEKRDVVIDPFIAAAPEDVRFTGQKEIHFPCRGSDAVKQCTWRKDEWILRLKDDYHIRFAYDESQGICDIYIRRPRAGIHTTKWKCSMQKMDGKTVHAPEVIVYVTNVSRSNYFDDMSQYQLMHVSQIKRKRAIVHLELKTEDETRIRWYVDGKLASSDHNSIVDIENPNSNKVYSSTTLDLTQLTDIQVVHVRCCVEYMSDLKQFQIFTIYVSPDSYDEFRRKWNESTLIERYQVIPPQPVLIVNGKEVTHLLMKIPVQYPTLNEVRVQCLETEAFPNSVINWQVIGTDVESASDYIEFNETLQVFSENEAISLHTIFLHPNSKAIIACHSRNIVAPRRYRRIAQARIELTYEAPVCETGDAASSSAGTSTVIAPSIPHFEFAIYLLINFYFLMQF